MLIKLAGFLVVVGILMLVVGIFIARRYTLRAKILTAFLVIVLSSLGVLTALDNYIMGESLISSTNRVLIAAARQQAERLDEFNKSNLNSIQMAANLPAIRSFLTLDGIEPYYRQTILEILKALQSGRGKVISSYAVLDAEGINLLDTNTHNIGNNESKQIYFRAAVSLKSPHSSPVIFSKKGVPSLYYSSPIYDQTRNLIGVLRAQLTADVLSKKMTRSRGLAGKGSFAILLDENYMRLVHGRRRDLEYTLANSTNVVKLSELKMARLIPADISSDFLENPQWMNSVISADYNQPYMEGRFYGLGTNQYSAAVVKLESLPWTVVYAQAQEVFLGSVIEQTQMALMLAIVVALIGTLLVMRATQFLLGPVRRLTGVVQGVGDGNMNVTAHIEADDEIGSLAKAFNDMTQNINGLIQDLEKEVEGHKLTAHNLRKLSVAIEQSPVSIMITDLDANIEYVNPQFCKITGYSLDEITGKNPRFLKSTHTPDAQYKSMWNAIGAGQSWSGELYNKKKNGDLFWENVTVTPIKNNEGKSTHYLAIKEDISLRKKYEEQLLYQASYDKLTDLPNRTLAYDRLQQAIANAVRENKHIALLYLDFDHFKNINDTLGHNAGDQFLVKMAARLKSYVRNVDTVARLGGDEFLIMLAEVGAESQEDEVVYMESIKQKTDDLLKSVSKPCMIEDMEFSVTASVGIAVFPRDGEDPHILLRNADTAMYRAKRKGRGAYEIFSPDMSDTVIRRVELDNKLRHALEDGKLYVKYQGFMDTQTRMIVGAEALLRWDDDELGSISPDMFIPLAEESGMIVDIGNWVLETVCTDINRWQQKKLNKNLYVALNLSSRQFRGRGIANNIADVLSRHGLSGESLELEITERLLMKDVPDVIAVLNQFKEMNIKLSIDDFGTGYSSLSYLKRFPFDVLKIDKSFVQGIETDEDDAALCDAIIAMAHSLGLSVIGEGVENEAQFKFLNSRGTEIVQGYYVSHPLVFDEFVEFISTAEKKQA